MGTTTGARRLQARMFYVITAVVVVMALGSWAVGVTRGGGGDESVTAKDENTPSETSTPFDVPPLPPEAEDDIFDVLDGQPTDGPTLDLGDLGTATPDGLSTDGFADPSFADPTFVDPSFPDDPTTTPPAGGNGGGGQDDGGTKPKPKPKPTPKPSQPPSETPSDPPDDDGNVLDPIIDPILGPITGGPLFD